MYRCATWRVCGGVDRGVLLLVTELQLDLSPTSLYAIIGFLGTNSYVCWCVLVGAGL